MPDHRKVAFVTGAGSGIGRAVALGLCADGYAVGLFGRRRERLEETTAAAPAGATRVISGDVGVSADVDAAFALVVREFGRLDLLFNNAGAAAPGPVQDLSDEQWDRVVRTNLSGAFYCARAAFRQMGAQTPRGGRIINNGSISAHAPRPNSIAYTATKHAMTGLTKSLSLDGRAHDIACGQIDIGNADTDLAARMKTGVPQPDGAVRAEPVMPVGDVVEAVLLMARLPLTSNVQFLTITATKMPFIGRG
jgi:NAD(P)-dependent dehydrogenase (short-subunit alcohol dehydrogenase family)